MPTQVEKAEAFRALHRGPRPFVLPNAWDVPSARVFEEAGFPAVATSSAGLMVSRGYPDGEEMPRRELEATVARIAQRLSIPLSADVVSGYGRSSHEVAKTVARVLDAGAVGVNIEDSDPRRGGLVRLATQLRRIDAVRHAAAEKGIPLVLNARTDAFREAPGDEGERMREAIRRASAFRDAGADCVYPMGLTAAGSIATFVEALHCPVNVMIRPGLPPLAELERLGVRRVSFGPAASYATMGLLKRVAREILDHGSFQSLVDGAIAYDELNRLAQARSAPTS
ncbi:MAG TPA: isocitrate lyase/phosphoenolpyruvate mutase family protein [Thermoplasmata archaeon]|nr:isocitrate lyase/phosphoenolpyruvate mutase family protein [Thermoplasmata archaeon]